MTRSPSDDSGAIAVIVALFAVTMLVFGTFVVEVGAAREVRRDAQAAADAAALAAAGELYDNAGVLHADEAINAAKTYAQDNFDIGQSPANYWDDCEATPPSSPPSSGWSTSVAGRDTGTECILFYRANPGAPYTKVQVVMPGKDTPSFFGGVSGKVRAFAQAGLEPPPTPCALCVFNMLNVGTGDVSVTGGGSVHAGDAGVQQPNGRIRVDSPGGIVFQNDPDPPSGLVYDPQPSVNGQPVADPFETHSMPNSSGTAYTGPGADSVNCGGGGPSAITELVPDRVYGSIDVKGACTMPDGLYVVTGLLHISGGPATLTGDNVTLFFTCGSRTTPSECESPGEDGGRLDANGGGQLAINGSSHSPFSLVYHRYNTSGLTVSGNAEALRLDGAVYAKRSDVTLNGGGSDPGLFTVNNQMVVNSVQMNGNNTLLTVNAGGLTSVAGPPEFSLIK